MTGWEERLLGVFDDLEQQAEGLALAERDARVADLARAGYAEVDLLSRLRGSLGVLLHLRLAGAVGLSGTVLRVGTDWLLLDDGRHEWLVPTQALEEVRGLPDRAVADSARPITARLGLGSVLRSLASDALPVLVHRRDGQVVRGLVRRVGADFVELQGDEVAGLAVVPWPAIAAVRAG
ncbi:MAG: hypothetical protein ACLGH4_05320 [Actinomycetes bacterium]